MTVSKTRGDAKSEQVGKSKVIKSYKYLSEKNLYQKSQAGLKSKLHVNKKANYKNNYPEDG